MTTTNNAPISFRLTNEEMKLLKQYQEDGEKSVNLTAKRLLLSALGVDVKKSSLQAVNTVDTNQIKELVDKAVREKLTELTTVDNVNSLKKHEVDQLINDRISAALEDGGDINSFVYKLADNVNNSVNHVYNELQELKAAIPPVVAPSSQSPVTNNQSPDTSPQSPITSPQSPVPSPQSPVTNHPSPITEEQKLDLIELLGIKEIVGGEVYYKQYLLKNGIDDRIKANMRTLENLGIAFNGNQKQPVAKLNFILTRLGYPTKNIGQRTIGDTRGIECYQVQS